MATKAARGVTAAEFFAQEFDRGDRMAAVRGAEISYPSVYEAARGRKTGLAIAVALQAWSMRVGAKRNGVTWYISAAKTVGLSEPSAEDLRKAASLA